MSANDPKRTSTAILALCRATAVVVVRGRYSLAKSLHRRHRLRQLLMQPALLVSAELRRLQNCNKFRELSGKSERHLVCILFQDMGSGILSDVKGFIERKADPDCSRY